MYVLLDRVQVGVRCPVAAEAGAALLTLTGSFDHVKRLAAMARELGKMGARIEERPDGMAITGGHRLHGAAVHSRGDHRMAMSLAVAALIAEGETVIDDVECVNTTFPQFTAIVNALAGTTAITVED